MGCILGEETMGHRHCGQLKGGRRTLKGRRYMDPKAYLEREVQDEHRDGDEEEHDVVVQVLGGLRIG